jgi:hypothetical protein
MQLCIIKNLGTNASVGFSTFDRTKSRHGSGNKSLLCRWSERDPVRRKAKPFATARRMTVTEAHKSADHRRASQENRDGNDS